MPALRPEIPQTWTIRDMIKWGREFFTGRGIDEARLTIEMMVCAALEIKRIDLYTDHDRPLSKLELGLIRSMVERRLQREPLQYILGKADFYGHTYSVSPAVLIPRPETELISERVSRYCRAHAQQTFRCLDLGTGSGCIPISIILHTQNTVWTALDVSEQALAVAKANAIQLGANERFEVTRANILNELPTGGPWDIITMNPPYVGENEIDELAPELKNYEPLSALTDHADGLTFYRRIAEITHNILAPGGVVFLEIGYDQLADVEKILRPFFGHLAVVPDLAGIPRMIVLEQPVSSYDNARG